MDCVSQLTIPNNEPQSVHGLHRRFTLLYILAVDNGIERESEGILLTSLTEAF